MFEEIKNCTNCDRHKIRKYVVLGKGNQKAKILLVGRDPGQNENEEGKPFIGLAGKKLDSILEKAELPKEEIAVINIVLCWGGHGNPKPTEKQIKSCHKNFITLLEYYQPELVVPLGAVALKKLTGRNIIGTARGKSVKPLPEYEKYGFKIIPSYHPSYILRDPSRESHLLSDFYYIKKEMFGRKDSHIKCIQADTLDAIDKMVCEIKSRGLVAVDTETNGLRLYDKIIGFSFSCNRNKGYYIPYLIKRDGKLQHYFSEEIEKKILERIKYIITNKKIQITGQNYKFDRLHMITNFGKSWDSKNVVFDTLLAAHLIDENCKHDLDTLITRYPDLIGYKKDFEKNILVREEEEKDYSNAPLKQLVEYASKDAIATFRLTEDLWKEIKGTKREALFFGLSLPYVDVCMQMELEGVKVDKKYLCDLDKELVSELEKLKTNIYKMAGIKFNINSTSQLSSILFNRLKLPAVKETKKSTKENPKYSTDRFVLEKLFYEHDIIKEIMKYKGLTTLYTRYIKSMKERLSDSSNTIVHPNNFITGTTSGRPSVKDPNLQQVSKARKETHDIGLAQYRDKIRPMFIPKEGNKFVLADYSQMELRILAWYSQDKAMLDVFNNDGDIHKSTAQAVFKTEKPTKEERDKAKTVNFGIVYGVGAYGLAQQLNIAKEDAKMYIIDFYRKYVGIKMWKRNELNYLYKYGFIENCFGRRRHAPEYKEICDELKRYEKYTDDWIRIIKKKNAIERTLLNAKIQGTASDVVKFGQIRCQKELPHYIKQILQVHDEIIFEMPDDNRLKENMKLIVSILERPIKPITIKLPVGITENIRWGVTP